MGRITIVDFSCAWVMKDAFQIARSKPGWMSREDVVKFYADLKVDGVELMDEYWHDCSPDYLISLTAKAGLPITCYVFFCDLAVPAAERVSRIDQGRKLLDRTAAIRSKRAMIVPAVYKPDISVADQTHWMIEGLRACAEHAQTLGITLLAENIDYAPMRPLMGRGTQCRDICKAVDSPAFRLIYDSGCSLAVNEDTFETLHTMAPYLAHVHLKNAQLLKPGEHAERYQISNTSQVYASTPLNAGIVDTNRVLSELDRIGYKGLILIENQGQDPLAVLPQDVAYLRSFTQLTSGNA
jgi:sugar phosphate isomerase/epimerase